MVFASIWIGFIHQNYVFGEKYFLIYKFQSINILKDHDFYIFYIFLYEHRNVFMYLYRKPTSYMFYWFEMLHNFALYT